MNKFSQFNEYFELGKIFYDFTAYHISIEYFNKAIELSRVSLIEKNKLSKLYRFKGDANMGLFNFKKAIIDYSKAIKFNVENADLYLYRGFSYNQIENYDKALKDIKYCLLLNPNNQFAEAMLNHWEKLFY